MTERAFLQLQEVHQVHSFLEMFDLAIVIHTLFNWFTLHMATFEKYLEILDCPKCYDQNIDGGCYGEHRIPLF